MQDETGADAMLRQDLLARAAVAVSDGAVDEAERCYQILLAEQPEDADAWANLAALRNMAGHHQEAEACARRALAAGAEHWGALANLGTALHRMARLNEAALAYVASLQRNPGNVSAATNLGVVLAEQWRMPQSLAMHEHALSLAPGEADVRFHRALALLAAGQLAEGFVEFEHRWGMSGMPPHGMAAPQWRGGPVDGLAVLLHDEGGFGDTLQFIRYAPLLAARGARVTALVQPALVRLLRQSMGDCVTILPRGATRPPHDLQCPMLSLPLAFGTIVETIPGQTPYLSAQPAARAGWERRLTSLREDGVRLVGLVWAGAPRPGLTAFAAMDRRRSIPSEALAPLSNAMGVRFISLQHHTAEPPPLPLIDHMEEMQDFADTAALVANLDLVISVDTAMAHLAGGLGVPTWLMSRHDACWRWLAGREDSPWYPHMRVYRQAAPGSWDEVLARVVRDLGRG